MRRRWSMGLAAMLVLGVAGCAASRPVLYPNEHLARVGDAGAQHDIDECKRLAEIYTSGRSSREARDVATQTVIASATGAAAGAAGGAVFGAAGRGAAAGAAGGAAGAVLHGLLHPRGPSDAYRNFVDACLSDRGYRVIGWE